MWFHTNLINAIEKSVVLVDTMFTKAAVVGKKLKCTQEPNNSEGRYAIASFNIWPHAIFSGEIGKFFLLL